MLGTEVGRLVLYLRKMMKSTDTQALSTLSEDPFINKSVDVGAYFERRQFDNLFKLRLMYSILL